MNIQEAEKMLTNIVEKFPNTDWELMDASMERFAYKITRCRLVELVKEVGHPELSDAFCPGDALYFERHQQDIDFSRPKNIAIGDECCDFIFKFQKTKNLN